MRGVYKPRRPQVSPLFRLVSDHLHRLQTVYDERFAREYGPWRPVVAQVADKFLACGVLEHGFNPRTIYPIPRRIVRTFFGVPAGEFFVLNLNRNQPRKRWDICMQAFAEVVKRRPEAPIRLIVATDLVGSWDLVQMYQRELKKRNVPIERGMARLFTPGRPQRMSDADTTFLYNLADVGINTCDGEGWGLCNFEQAGLGIPQIVPRLGGFEHFFDDDTATLIDPIMTYYVDSGRDGVGGEAQLTLSDDYADAILRYYDDPELRARHGREARRRILQRFPWDRIADDLAAVCDRLCEKPGNPIGKTVEKQNGEQNGKQMQKQINKGEGGEEEEEVVDLGALRKNKMQTVSK